MKAYTEGSVYSITSKELAFQAVVSKALQQNVYYHCLWKNTVNLILQSHMV